MQFNLSGKTALITGSSKGIGLSIAKALHKQNCKIALNSRNYDELKLVASQFLDAIYVVGDVTQPNEARRIVSEVIKSFGKIDILVCSVGSGKSLLPGEENLEEWQRIFSLNLWSTTNMVEAARLSLEHSKGNIVCISSICGLEVVEGAPIAYSAAKAALHAYVKGISRPLGQKCIRINAIAPGNILFGGSVWEEKLQNDKVSVEKMINKNVSLGRLGSPEDIANLVVYLASNSANFVTGVVWPIDGGQIRS